jgi:hypothetical protein
MLIILILNFVGCLDIRKKLPNGYIYLTESSQEMWIQKNPLSINSKSYIPCKILEYQYNERYILAKIKFHYDMNCVVGFEESKTLTEGKIYYYIIDSKKHVRYGAYENINDFNHKLKELKINLRFE